MLAFISLVTTKQWIDNKKDNSHSYSYLLLDLWTSTSPSTTRCPVDERFTYAAPSASASSKST
jgi:hypothetical protein